MKKKTAIKPLAKIKRVKENRVKEALADNAQTEKKDYVNKKYRIKTEEEFIKEFGEGWRSKITWNEATGIDIFFGVGLTYEEFIHKVIGDGHGPGRSQFSLTDEMIIEGEGTVNIEKAEKKLERQQNFFKGLQEVIKKDDLADIAREEKENEMQRKWFEGLKELWFSIEELEEESKKFNPNDKIIFLEKVMKDYNPYRSSKLSGRGDNKYDKVYYWANRLRKKTIRLLALHPNYQVPSPPLDNKGQTDAVLVEMAKLGDDDKMNTLQIQQSNQNTKQKDNNIIRKGPQTFDELFDEKYSKPEIIELYVDVLRKVDPPLINDYDAYIGRYKTAFVIWINMLIGKEILKQKDEVYSRLLNSKFKGLDMGRDGGMFRKYTKSTTKYKEYENDLKALISMVRVPIKK